MSSVLVENAAKRGRLRFALPGVQPRAKLRPGRADLELALALDTVIVEPDEERLVLAWRGKCEVHGKRHEVGRETVGLLPL